MNVILSKPSAMDFIALWTKVIFQDAKEALAFSHRQCTLHFNPTFISNTKTRCIFPCYIQPISDYLSKLWTFFYFSYCNCQKYQSSTMNYDRFCILYFTKGFLLKGLNQLLIFVFIFKEGSEGASFANAI